MLLRINFCFRSDFGNYGIGDVGRRETPSQHPPSVNCARQPDPLFVARFKRARRTRRPDQRERAPKRFDGVHSIGKTPSEQMMDVEATKKGETMDNVADDWWKSIEEQVKKGRRLDELRTELRRVVGSSSNNHIGSFFRRHPPSCLLAFRPAAAAATSSISSPTRTTTTNTNADDDAKQPPEERLEQIQMHVKLCVLVWAATTSSVPKQQQQGDVFVKAYAKWLRKKKKALMKQTKKTKRKQQLRLMMNDQTDEQIVLDDLVRILQRAAFYLDPQATLAQFLSDCIPRDCYRPSMGFLWDFFELPNPYEPPTPPAELPPLVLVVKQRKTSKRRRLRNEELSKKAATTLMETTPNQPTIQDENQSLVVMPDHVPLTAPILRKHNSLTQRNRFVGSHFNSGLSNMDVLFRQVTVVKAKKVTTKSQPPPKPTKRPHIVTPRCHNNNTLLIINVVPSTPCAIRKKPPPLVLQQPQQHQHTIKMASVVAEAFRSIKRRRRI
jgi:hypothetical protein